MMVCFDQIYCATPDQKTWEYAQKLLINLGFDWEEGNQSVWTEDAYPYLACIDGELNFSDEDLSDQGYRLVSIQWLEQAMTNKFGNMDSLR